MRPNADDRYFRMYYYMLVSSRAAAILPKNCGAAPLAPLVDSEPVPLAGQGDRPTISVCGSPLCGAANVRVVVNRKRTSPPDRGTRLEQPMLAHYR
jgi:hypothetical protein